MRMRIAVDLDNTIFNTAEKYRSVIEAHGCIYTPPVSYNIYNNGYPTHVADALRDMLESDEIYKTHVLDERIPMALNAIYNNPKYMLFYVTERDLSYGRDLQQLNGAGIQCGKYRLLNSRPKIDALKRYGIKLCFDDAPHVVSDCLENNIDIVMISNADTAYNHHLRGAVEYYPDFMTALTQRGMIQR